MSYLERIAECNRHDADGYVGLEVAGSRVGAVRRDRLATLRRLASCLDVSDDGVRLDPALDTPAARTAAMAEVTHALMECGEVRAWRGERYPVLTAWGQPALLELERAAVPWFGVRAFGVHVNGFVRGEDGPRMWVARRARDKPTYPGMLDNVVAGGQPVGLGLLQNVIKECGEEAGIPSELAGRARAVGAITYCAENETGLKPDCMFCFDLELPEDFVPHPADGEAEGFDLRPIAEVARLVRDTTEFKFNCNLVVLDFLVRHGLLDVEGADYLAIVRGLRAW